MSLTILGATNEDHTFSLEAPLRLKDSNPVKDHMSLGGVGFNIAKTLELFKEESLFLTAFDDSIKALFRNIIIETTEKPSYYAVINHDMEVAFAAMESLKYVNGDVFIPHLNRLEKEDILCADLNFETDLLIRLFKETKAKIYIEATSAHKVLKVHSLIPFIYGLKLNMLEAKVLTHQNEVENILNELEKMPFKEIILTAGDMGVYLINETITHYQDQTPFEQVHMSGVGDAFMAGYLLKSTSVFDQIHHAMTLAYLTAKSDQSTIPSLDIQKFMKEKEKRHVRILSSRPRSTQ